MHINEVKLKYSGQEGRFCNISKSVVNEMSCFKISSCQIWDIYGDTIVNREQSTKIAHVWLPNM